MTTGEIRALRLRESAYAQVEVSDLVPVRSFIYAVHRHAVVIFRVVQLFVRKSHPHQKPVSCMTGLNCTNVHRLILCDHCCFVNVKITFWRGTSQCATRDSFICHPMIINTVVSTTQTFPSDQHLTNPFFTFASLFIQGYDTRMLKGWFAQVVGN